MKEEKEKGLHSLIHNILADIMIIDRNYLVTDVNNHLMLTSGKVRDEVIGKHCYEVSHNLDVPCSETGEECLLRMVFADGQTRNCRHEHIHADGSKRAIDILLSPLTDNDGNVSHVVETIHDVSSVLEALEESEGRFRALFNSAGDSIFIHDMKGRFLEVNDTACERLGYSREDLLEKTFKDIDSTDFHSKGSKNLNELIEKGSLIVETAHVTKDGIVIPVEVSARIISYAGESAVLSIARDITERKRAEQYVQSANEMQKNRAEATISHLATFPELNPNPVLEVDEAGNIKYQNPISQELFPGLADLGAKHPFLVEWDKVCKKLKRQSSIIRDIKVNDSWYEQGIAFVPVTQTYHIYGRNITKRLNAQQALKRSEYRYRMLFENANDAIILWDFGNEKDSTIRILDANSVALRRYDYNYEEMLNLTSNDLNVPGSLQGIEEALSSLMKHGQATYELTHKDRSGNPIPVEVSGHLFEMDGRRVVLSIIRDITERKEADRALMKSERRYRRLFNAANDAILVQQPQPGYQPGKFVEANEVACRMLGYSREELMQMTSNDIVQKRKGILTPHKVLTKLFEKQSLTFDSMYVAKDGHTIPVEISMHLFDLGEKPTVMAISRDTTKRVQSEKELRQKEQRIRQLASAYVGAQEEEREWMALEIHDRIIQPVLAIRRNLELLTPSARDKEAVQILKQGLEITRDTIEDARHLTTTLYPTTLSRYGLTQLINEELEQLEQKIGCRTSISVAGKLAIPNHIQTTIYRVFHEALLNIAKHSGASEVDVSLSVSRGQIHLVISDNGCGFNVKTKLGDKSPKGLQSMKRRTELIGGAFKLTNTNGKGTKLSFIFPLAKPE